MEIPINHGHRKNAPSRFPVKAGMAFISGLKPTGLRQKFLHVSRAWRNDCSIRLNARQSARGFDLSIRKTDGKGLIKVPDLLAVEAPWEESQWKYLSLESKGLLLADGKFTWGFDLKMTPDLQVIQDLCFFSREIRSPSRQLLRCVNSSRHVFTEEYIANSNFAIKVFTDQFLQECIDDLELPYRPRSNSISKEQIANLHKFLLKLELE